MKTSPTQRSLKLIRTSGAYAHVVEKWNPFAKIRQDVFGWIDIVAVDPKILGVLGVQTTTRSNLAARMDKAKGNPALISWLLTGGRLECHGWIKRKGQWVCDVKKISMEDLTAAKAEA